MSRASVKATCPSLVMKFELILTSFGAKAGLDFSACAEQKQSLTLISQHADDDNGDEQ